MGWGKGSENNNIGWGQAAGSASNDWGKSQKNSYAGQTDIVGITVLNISYSASNYCLSGGNTPQPTVNNNVGVGSFSSTSGLVIDSSTGVINSTTSTVGSYVVTYTDTDAATATATIGVLALPNVVVSVSIATICAGESTVLTASGASTYVWNDGETLNPRTVSPTTTTTFTATGSDGVCTNTGATTITVNALPTVAISGTLTYCAGSTTTLTATAGLSSYLWSTGATTQAINVTAGSYTVTGTDSNGCSATSAASAVTELPLDTATVTYSSSAYCQMPTGATAVDGYYPLYSTASAANAVSNDGQNHTHYLSGQTYYMPGASAGSNPGVVLYHNTYSLTTPAPTITGETGTFSESTGNLSIDSSTGVITLNSSTAGTYTVVYTTNGSCPNTVNNTITINALDGATFAYSSNSLPQSGTASLTTTPTTSGGVYSAYPSGLSINSSTGEIDLAASTIQSYKIFYETSGAGCPNSSTFDLAVTAAGISNVYSMNFDSASSDYIEIPANSSLDFTTQFTLSTWVKFSTNYRNQGLIAKGSVFNVPYSLITLNSATPPRLMFTLQSNSATGGTAPNVITEANSMVTNQWYHIGCVYNGSLAATSRAKIYIDGQLKSIANVGTIPSSIYVDNLKLLKIGSWNNNYFDGKLDEVAIWNTALTASQIQSIYDATGTNLTKDLTTVSGSNLKYWNRMGD